MRQSAEYRAYLASPEWQERRQEALTRAGNRCELCESTRRLHVHHLSYRHFRNEPPKDLQVLCRDCHAKAHGQYVILEPGKRPRYASTKPRKPLSEAKPQRNKLAESLTRVNDRLHEKQKRARQKRAKLAQPLSHRDTRPSEGGVSARKDAGAPERTDTRGRPRET